METCPSCEKGFLTEQINEHEDSLFFGDYIIKVLSDRFYKFCSNVMCSYQLVRFDEKSRRKIEIKK